MCSFHMTADHDEQDCPELLNCVQMARNAIAIEKASKESKARDENQGTYFLEYESDSERGVTMFTTLQNLACTIMTRGQKSQKPYPSNSLNTTAPKGKEPAHTDSTKVADPKI